MTSVDTTDSNDQIKLLAETVERLRSQTYPHLDASLIRDLLLLHAGGVDDADLSRSVEQLVERSLQKGNHS